MTDTSLTSLSEYCESARVSFRAYRLTAPEVRATLLERLADALEAARPELVALAAEESHLPLPRLEGELSRTTGQIRMFAQDLRDGKASALTTVEALPDRKPLPRPRLTRSMIPIGPVAVFGASNFPFAFGSLGGDTASALAAGCPVVCKANPAHPKLAAKLGSIANTVMRLETGEHLFWTVYGGPEVGQALVSHPAIQAVGFTGSERAGRSLMDTASRRDRPIPVYAEMGSVNPVFLLPGALESRAEALAAGYVQSVTLGAGQFCTNPGVVVAPQEGGGLVRFTNEVIRLMGEAQAQPMLTEGISHNYLNLCTAMESRSECEVLVPFSGAGSPALYAAPLNQVDVSPKLLEEIFGPAGVLLRARDWDEVIRFIENMPGQLTASIHFEENERSQAEALIKAVAPQVGRIVLNGWPTGVEVCEAMHHGGPYPAASFVHATSVGNFAMQRWLRPLCIQE